jgi:DNA-directed RNA polymerase specialized sigma24 family protein
MRRGLRRDGADDLDLDLDDAASAALRAHGPAVLRYLHSLLGDGVAVYEVYSDFSDAVWRAPPRFRRDADVRIWAFKLAWIAAHSWKPRATSGDASPVVAGEPVGDRWRVLEGSLDLADRSLLVLRVDHRMSWRGIAEVMTRDGSVVEAAVLRERFDRLKSQLRELAVEHGLRPVKS